MSKKGNNPLITNEFVGVILILLVLFSVAGFAIYIFMSGIMRTDRIAREVCHTYNLSFDYVRGSTAYCSVYDNRTGLRKVTTMDMDLGRCEELYVKNKTKTIEAYGGMYYVNLADKPEESDCQSEKHTFSVSHQDVICFRCVDTTRSLFNAVPAGSWVCPI